MGQKQSTKTLVANKLNVDKAKESNEVKNKGFINMD